MAKRGRKRKSVREIVSSAALKAVEDPEDVETEDAEAEVDSPEERDQNLADLNFLHSSPQEVDEKDIFIDGLNKCRMKNTTPKFRIYRDGEWIGTKEGQYSWERLQKEFGGGYFKIVCVDRSNAIVGTQVQSVAPPEGWEERHNPAPMQSQSLSREPGTLEMLEVMRETQREAKSELHSQSSGQTTALATMMTAMSQSQQNMMTSLIQSQQQSSQQFQMLMVELQKSASQAQQENNKTMMTLLTSMLSQKKSGDELGIRDIVSAEERGEKRAKEMHQLIDQKVEKLAEEKAELLSAASEDKEKEESFTKTLLKSFVPIATSALAQQNQARAVQSQENFSGPQVPAPGSITPQQMEEIQAQHRQRVEAEKRFVQNTKRAVPQVVRKEAAPGARVVKPISNQPATASSQGTPTMSNEKDKEKMFDLVKTTIGQNLITGGRPDRCAAQCLEILEKNGFKRQTVKEVLTLNDILRYAKMNGVPDMARPWFEGFYGSIENLVPPAPPIAGDVPGPLTANSGA